MTYVVLFRNNILIYNWYQIYDDTALKQIFNAIETIKLNKNNWKIAYITFCCSHHVKYSDIEKALMYKNYNKIVFDL